MARASRMERGEEHVLAPVFGDQFLEEFEGKSGIGVNQVRIDAARQLIGSFLRLR